MASLTAITPSNISLSKFDFATSESIYKVNPQKAVKLVPLLMDGKPFKLTLVGQLFTEGILVSEEFGTHSIGFNFEDPNDVTQLNLLFNCFDAVKDDLSLWETRSIIKNEDQIWFKLKHGKDKSAYRFRSNIKLFPKKPEAAPLDIGDDIQATVDVSAYFAFENGTFGICLNLRELKVNPESETVSSKKK